MAEIAKQLDEEENAELDEDRGQSVNMDDSGESGIYSSDFDTTS